MDAREIEKQNDQKVRDLLARGFKPRDIAANEPHLAEVVRRVTAKADMPTDAAVVFHAPPEIGLEVAAFAANHSEEVRERHGYAIHLSDDGETVAGAVAKLLPPPKPRR